MPFHMNKNANRLCQIKKPLVSIVMCTYNGSQYLDEQLNSIVNQDYRPIEIVVVDDCSKDETWKKLKHWENKYSDIFRLYSNETNLGYNKNFEKALLLAKGEYIAISDQDDIWMFTKISALVNSLETKTWASMAHCKNVTLTKDKLKFNHTNLRNFFEGTDVRKLFLYSQFSGHVILFRKTLLEKIIPFPDGIIYDWWIGVNACVNGGIAFVDEVLVHHRIHSSNATDSARTCPLDIDELLQLFYRIENMNQSHRNFLDKLISLFKQHKKNTYGKIDWKLFHFFFANRKIIYGHKRRKLPIISQTKHAFRLSRKSLAGVGGEI